ncbi:Asp-tRNA(Asn)/Glu-tRNA(Gln) amidotransferase subunit GatB [candidate division KSB1 bacterium]|nr:Asp-tRNA(Asn)/Glu-tRNA(Gln) amidotransferase subunit GatB [candidate division KSB1 bacterium]
MDYEAVIGLEVHAQLLTDSKAFCKCSARFGGEQNQQVCPICMGMPGVLPVMNAKAVDFAIKMGIATNCEISARSIMARKNYFYPDLPKGYQISQYEEPLCKNGFVEIKIDDQMKKIRLNRIHLEEDAGKSIHAEEYVDANETLIDLNRCGVPLVEIVSEPDISSPREAYLYLSHLRQILQYLEICDGNLEEGSLRCDANVSIKPVGTKKLGVSTELKNMNSFHGIEKALEFEINRQKKIVAAGGNVQKQTLLWDAANGIAAPMRSKELAHDYRYFPDPDLVPIDVDQNWIDRIKARMPELPSARKARLINQYNLPDYAADVLTGSKTFADFFEECLTHISNAKLVSNLMLGAMLRVLNEKKIDFNRMPVQPKNFAQLVELIINNTINESIAKTVFEKMVDSGQPAAAIVQESGLSQVSDNAHIEALICDILETNPAELKKYRAGKTKLFGFFMGQVMKASRGKANPKIVEDILKRKLDTF